MLDTFLGYCLTGQYLYVTLFNGLGQTLLLFCVICITPLRALLSNFPLFHIHYGSVRTLGWCQFYHIDKISRQALRQGGISADYGDCKQGQTNYRKANQLHEMGCVGIESFPVFLEFIY